MLKYLVEIDYKKFEFENAMDAISFANDAKRHVKDGEDYDVTITLEDVSDDNTETETEIEEEI